MRVSDAVHDRVCEARRRTGWGPRLIASELGMAHATVSRCLARRGISRRPAVPREQVRRFEWPCPGDLLQMDTKRLARFTRPGHRVTGDRYRTGREKRLIEAEALLVAGQWQEAMTKINALRTSVISTKTRQPLDHRRPLQAGLHRDPSRRTGPDRYRFP